jgi:hypothetical protein
VLHIKKKVCSWEWYALHHEDWAISCVPIDTISFFYGKKSIWKKMNSDTNKLTVLKSLYTSISGERMSFFRTSFVLEFSKNLFFLFT